MNYIKISLDIKKIIRSYLLPSLELIKINKQNYLHGLKEYVANIRYYLNDNKILAFNGIRTCNTFSDVKYKYLKTSKFNYWSLRKKYDDFD